MAESKQVKCSSCGQLIKTALGSFGINKAAVVCRRCFGEQSYAGPAHWGHGMTIQGRGPTDG